MFSGFGRWRVSELSRADNTNERGVSYLTNEINRNAEKYQKQHKRRSIWHRAISILSAVTVFITTYALILPAITMEPAPGIRLDRTFRYETESLILEVDVVGRASFEKASEAQPTASAENVVLTVTPLEEKSSAYAAYQCYAEEFIQSDDMRQLLLLRLNFTHKGARLNTDNCDMEIRVAAKSQKGSQGPQLLQNRPNGVISGNDAQSGETLALTAFQNIDKDISEQTTAYADARGNLNLRTKIRGSTLGLVMYATVNPKFTVQYYAHITMLDEANLGASDAYIPVIDTSGKKLPTNGGSWTEKHVHLSRLPGSQYVYRMAMLKVLQPLYTAKNFEYIKAPSLAYMDRLYGASNYSISEIWVLKPGKSSTSINRDDWTIYSYSPATPIYFTNRAESATANRIYLADGTVMRFVYNESSSYFSNDADFFDYDISDGYIYNASGTRYNTTAQDAYSTTQYWSMRTSNYGINNFTAASGTVKLAFGNVNTGTDYGNNTWNGQSLNKYNSASGIFGCTFGLVTGLNGNGLPVFANGVTAPDMFSPQNGTGKTYLDDYYLSFARTGDNYVLSSVNEKATDYAVVDGLLLFHNPGYTYNGTTTRYTSIFTNNFWPMDAAPTFGADGHDMIFGGVAQYKNALLQFKNGTAKGTLPPGDDGLHHNSYFGMTYKINFTLDADYVGPLEYMFYGDDDMWVFLDGRLVCDIGGVHSSVGQYVNLRDYLPLGSSGNHTLSFFYTERGASGSTCYMQFTLPSVDSNLTQVEPNTLELDKIVENAESTQEFQFTIDLLDASGDPLVDDYSFTRYDANGVVIGNGILNSSEKTVMLRGGERLTVDFLPDGAQFVITEESYPGYSTSYRINGGTAVFGSTASGTVDKHTAVTFINTTSVALPATGGIGLWVFCIPLAAGFVLLLIKGPLDRWLENRKNRNQ